MKTQKEVRIAFWQGSPHLKLRYSARKRQNDYPATIRSEWVDFVDMLNKNGHISDKLANRVTL